MTPAFVFDTLRKRARAFRHAKRGNVIVTFALSLIPMVAMVGAAVDYSRGNSAKAAMQQAIDATGLILSKDASTMLQDALNTKAQALFTTLINRPEILNVVVTPVLSNPSEGTFLLQIAATAKVDTTFTKILGKDHLDLSVNTEIRWGMKKLELALALDNTGSMGQNSKMVELKKALLNIKGQNGATADGLLITLKNAAKQAGDVRISVIPFDIAVRIGTTYKNETWLNWTKEYGTCSSSSYVTKADCQAHNKTWTPTNNPNVNNWTGCVLDRDTANDVADTTPDTGTASTLFPTTRYSSCTGLVEALPLTDIWNTGYQTLYDKINSMQPNQNTNVTIGLAWAWHSLTPSLPWTEALAAKPDLDKVIILLTDGDNTQNRFSTTQSQIDARTTAACDNVRVANIKLYTIRVIDGNASLLKSCATKTSMYFEVSQASQLSPVFASIAQDLANLRIAK